MEASSGPHAAGDAAGAAATPESSPASDKGEVASPAGSPPAGGAGSGGPASGQGAIGPRSPTEAAGARGGTRRIGPGIEGPLEKRGASLMGKWQMYWCRLADGKLIAYDMEDIGEEHEQSRVILKHVTSSSWQDGSREFALEVDGKMTRFRAKTPHEAQDWFTHLQSKEETHEDSAEEEQTGEPATTDVLLQVHTIFGLPLSGDSEPCYYSVRAAWKDSHLETCSEERPGTGNVTSPDEDCPVLQQLLLARVPGHHVVNVRVCRRRALHPADAFQVLGRCELSTILSHHRSVHLIQLVDENEDPTGISVRMKLKVLADSSRSTSQWSDASKLVTQVRSDASPSVVDWLLTGVLPDRPQIEMQEQDEEEGKRDEQSKTGASGISPPERVLGLYQRHAERLARLEAEQKQAELEEKRRLQEEIEANRVGTRARIESLRPMEAAERLYHDAKVGEFRKMMMEQKRRQEEEAALEHGRFWHPAKRGSSAPERAKRASEALSHMHELHALHKEMLARQQHRSCTPDMVDESRSASPMRAASPSRLVELYNHGAERLARRRSLSRRREKQMLVEISRTCHCGNPVGDDKDVRCMFCTARPPRTPDRSRSPNPEVAQKLYADHARKMFEREDKLESKKAQEDEDIKDRCSCGHNLGEDKSGRKISVRRDRCPVCFAKNPAIEREDGSPDRNEILKAMDKLHQAGALRDKKRLRMVEQGHQKEKQRTQNTCVCGFDYSMVDTQGELTRCPQCHGKRCMPGGDPKPDGWVSDRTLALLLSAVSTRCGRSPSSVGRGLRDLAQPLKAAVREYHQAAQHSESKSPGYTQLCKLVSMRVYCDGTLMKDPQGVHQCCEPDPIRQLYEDLDTLMVTAAKAQDLLLTRVGSEKGAARPNEMSKRWPAGAQWNRPAAVKSALFAYNPGAKSKEAAHRKALVLYGPSEGPRRHRHLMDLARLSLVFADCESLQVGLEQVCAEFEVLDVRNKYHPSSPSNLLGERFVEVLVAIKGPKEGVSVPFLCELRLEELCYFKAREAARPHLEKVYHGFRAVYKSVAGKDLDAIEYVVQWALHRPQESQLLRLFRRHLAQRFGSSVAAFRTLLGDGILIPFTRFREACQLLGKRESTVEFWLELDPGRGGCLSIFELDPEAAAFLSKAYAMFSDAVDRDEAAIDNFVTRLSGCHRTQTAGLYSADTFRDAIRTLGFSHEEATRAFSYLDLHRPNKWRTPQKGSTSAFLTIKDVRWLLKLPDRLHVEAVALASGRRSILVDGSARHALGQRTTEEGHSVPSSKALTLLRSRRLMQDRLTADVVLKLGDANPESHHDSRESSPEPGQDNFLEAWGGANYADYANPSSEGGRESMHLRRLSEEDLAEIMQMRAVLSHPQGAFGAVKDMSLDSTSDDISTGQPTPDVVSRLNTDMP